MANQTNNAELLKQYCKGKTAEQVKVIEYFCKDEGCLSKNMSDDEYSSMVIKKRDSLNLRQKALSKIGLDEDEVSEIPPAVFEGYVFKNAFAKKRANGNWVSSSYQVAWLFFSSTQIYIYRYTFNMDEDKRAKVPMSSSTKMSHPSLPVLKPKLHIALETTSSKLKPTSLRWLFLGIRFLFLWTAYPIPKISSRL